MKLYPSRKAAQALGIHPNTLRRWAAQGKIQFVKTAAGQHLYDVDAMVGGNKPTRRICYCRVSSAKQRDDLERQVAYLQARFPDHSIMRDIGSGLNFRRKGFQFLLESICKGEVSELVVAHRDRLARCCFDLIKWLVERQGGKVVVLNDVTHSPERELTTDLLTILHGFSCRLHGLRKYRAQIKATYLPDNE